MRSVGSVTWQRRTRTEATTRTRKHPTRVAVAAARRQRARRNRRCEPTSSRAGTLQENEDGEFNPTSDEHTKEPRRTRTARGLRTQEDQSREHDVRGTQHGGGRHSGTGPGKTTSEAKMLTLESKRGDARGVGQRQRERQREQGGPEPADRDRRTRCLPRQGEGGAIVKRINRREQQPDHPDHQPAGPRQPTLETPGRRPKPRPRGATGSDQRGGRIGPRSGRRTSPCG